MLNHDCKCRRHGEKAEVERVGVVLRKLTQNTGMALKKAKPEMVKLEGAAWLFQVEAVTPT